jgi:hypothetical protein
MFGLFIGVCTLSVYVILRIIEVLEIIKFSEHYKHQTSEKN